MDGFRQNTKSIQQRIWGMKIIRQNILPPKGFLAINLFGYLFCRPNAKITDITINHEQIHTEQMKEMLYVPFYLWYGVEWLVKLFCKGNAYRNLSFEREAYSNQYNLDYLKQENIIVGLKDYLSNV